MLGIAGLAVGGVLFLEKGLGPLVRAYGEIMKSVNLRIE